MLSVCLSVYAIIKADEDDSGTVHPQYTLFACYAHAPVAFSVYVCDVEFLMETCEGRNVFAQIVDYGALCAHFRLDPIFRRVAFSTSSRDIG